MLTQYLMIQNKYEAPTESFIVLGASSRRATKGLAIGQFGTGAKHAVNIAMREGLTTRVYCGRKRIDFGAKRTSFRGNEQFRVAVRMNNRGEWKILDRVIDFGAIDWKDIGMGLREYVSNAIDETLARVDEPENGSLRKAQLDEIKRAIEAGELCVKIVDEKDVRAKSGFTRVFVEVNDDVRQWYAELPRRFLHFSNNPEDLLETLLPKRGRELTDSKAPMIYRQGVLVLQLRESNTESIYDYNFDQTQMRIDDSRNSNEYLVRVACGRALKRGTTEGLVPVITAAIKGQDRFETKNIDPDYLGPEWNDNTEQMEARFQEAWEAAAGADTIACEPAEPVVGYVKRKGREPVTVKSERVLTALKAARVPSAADMIKAEGDKAGREPVEVTGAAIAVTQKVWAWFQVAGMTNGKDQPDVRCYKDLMNAESDTVGYADEEAVYYRDDIASGSNDLLTKTAVEEVTHYITGSGDSSRDIQQFLIDMIVGVCD